MLGTALIILGVLLLLDKADVIDYSWPMILVLVGAAFLVSDFMTKQNRSLFVGLLLTLLGLAFLGIEYDWFGWRLHNEWPVLLLAVGLAFMITSLIRGEKRGMLVPGGIITGIALLFLAVEARWIDSRAAYDIFEWWPLILLGVGVWLIMDKRN
jgi:hypothetical protein